MTAYTIPGILNYNANPVINIEQIVKQAAAFLQVPLNILQSPTRQRVITEKRMLIFNYLHTKGVTSTAIGQYFNRDHSTVLHGIKTIKNLCSTNADLLMLQTQLHYHLKINNSHE